MRDGGPAPAVDTFDRALADERLANARRLNLFRFQGLSVFLALMVVLRVARVYWVGPPLGVFGFYWAMAAVLLWASLAPLDRIARLSGLSIPILDMPMLSWLLLATIVYLHEAGFHADASRLAFHAPVYFVGLLFLASLSLKTSQVYLATGVACALEAVLAFYVGGTEVALLTISVLATALAGLLFAEGGTRAVRLVRRVSSEQLRRERLGRYFSPQVAAWRGREGAGAAGEHREVTVLFSDIRDFTALTETLRQRAGGRTC